MVEFACPAQGKFSCFIDFVVTDPSVIGDGLFIKSCRNASSINLFRCFARECPVWALSVIDLLKLIYLMLKFLQGNSWWLFPRSFLQCLMEAFNLALSLWIVGLDIFLLYALRCHQIFKGGFSFGLTGGVNNTMIGQRGLKSPLLVCVFCEGINNNAASDPVMNRN